MANLFRSLGGENDKKLKDLLDGINRGAKVEIAAPVEAPASVEALTPRVKGYAPDPPMPNDLDMAQLTGIGQAAAQGQRYDPAPVNAQRQTLGDQQLQAKLFHGTTMPDQSIPQPGPIEQHQPVVDALPNTLQAPEMARRPHEVLMENAKNAKTPEQISDVIANADDYEEEKKPSLFKRFFKGIARGYKNWDGSGGLAGLVINTLGQGVASSASPKVYEGLGRENLQNKMFRKLAVARDREQYEGKVAGQNAQQENLYNQIAMRTASTQNDILDDIADNKRADDAARTAATKPTAVKYNGKWYNRLPDGTETPMLGADGQQRTELTDVPIATTLSDGTPIFTTGDKALDREITQNLNQSRLDFEAKKLNQADLDKYEGEVSQWAEKEAERKAKVSKLILDGEALQNQAAALEQQAQSLSVVDADQKADLLAKAAKARADGNSLVKQGNELRNIPTPKPKKPAANLTAPNLSVGTYSEADFTKRAKDRGITGDALKAAIAKARQDGIIK